MKGRDGTREGCKQRDYVGNPHRSKSFASKCGLIRPNLCVFSCDVHEEVCLFGGDADMERLI